ncbi:hypothetical protein FS837_002863 [Tulasnella sp. UAMH 9824]|nr:hypothetical protein FS837_002863 [Tulasnella sp. UAMH 9824]
MANRTSSNRSYSLHTRDDISNYLEEELAFTTESVTADAFLHFAKPQTLWDTPAWSDMVAQLTADETQQQLNHWSEIEPETDQYEPFCAWVEHLLTFISQLPSPPTRQIRFQVSSRINLACTPGYSGGEEVPGTASAFSPDVVCIHRDVEEFGKWSQVKVPFEFKKRRRASSKKASDKKTSSKSATPSRSDSQTPDLPAPPQASRSRTGPKRSRQTEDDETAPQGKKARPSAPYATFQFQSSATPPQPPVQSRHTPTNEELQLARYAMETFAAVGDRTHVFAVFVKGPAITLWYFDRCGAVRSSPLNTDTSEGFVQFVKFLSSLMHMSDEALGFNPFFTNSSNTDPPGLRAGLLGLSVDIPNSENAYLTFKEELDRRTGLVSRATLVWKADLSGGESGPDPVNVVIKSSWQHSTRTPESQILFTLHENHQAKDLIVWCFHGWEQPGTIVSSQRAKFGESAPPVVGDRALRHTVLEYLSPVTTLSQPFHIRSIGWSVMQAIGFLNDMEWYHRDISIGNIGFSSLLKCGGVLIKLHDFDLSKNHSSNSGAPHWTGTVPFMSIELLEQPETHHRIGFEVEALMWTLLWIVRVYTNGEDKTTVGDHPLKLWLSNNLGSVAAEKKNYLQKISGYTNEFYRELEEQIADLAAEWNEMRNDQWKERRRANKPLLISESLYETPGFLKIQDWMTEKGWNEPSQRCSCGKHCALIAS